MRRTYTAPAERIGQRLATERRSLGIDDPLAAPNNSRRHRFATIARRLKVSEATIDPILGHTPCTVGRRYGESEIAAPAVAIRRIPTIRIDEAGADSLRETAAGPRAATPGRPGGDRPAPGVKDH